MWYVVMSNSGMLDVVLDQTMFAAPSFSTLAWKSLMYMLEGDVALEHEREHTSRYVS
jgi:hypothetical protein